MMKVLVCSTAILLSTLPISAQARDRRDSLCPPLRSFAASIGPDETRTLVFHTSWGGNFKDSKELVIYAKRCIHGGYKQAESVCDDLMQNGSVEFGNYNAMRAIVCLSPKTRFSNHASFERGEFSLMYGTENRGANISVTFEEDSVVGGMALRIVADGY
jgi:hypothetical protein